LEKSPFFQDLTKDCDGFSARPENTAAAINKLITMALDNQTDTGIQPPPNRDATPGTRRGGLAATTMVITERGTFSLETLASEQAMPKLMSTRARWLAAQVTCIGEEKLWRIHMERHGREKEFLATADQIWFVYKSRDIVIELPTAALLPGHPLKSMWSTVASDRVPSPVGIMHGIVLVTAHIRATKIATGILRAA
jgi:hypothetical protein